MEKKMKRFLMIIGCSFPFLCVGCSSGPNMEEGKWEISMDMGVKGIPVKMPAMTFTQCLTKDEMIPQDKSKGEGGCEVIEKEIDGDNVSWKVVCNEGAVKTESSGSITYSGKLMSGTIDMSISGGPMAMTANNTITGKYVGPCDEK